MREELRLLVPVAEGSIIVTAAFVIVGLFAFRLKTLSVVDQWVGAVVIVAAAVLAAGWIYRRLRTYHPRREARAAAITVAVSSPISLFLAILLGQFFGGNASERTGNHFEFLSAILGFAASLTLVNYVLISLALWITRRTIEAERANP
jgi:heme A synthase